MAKYQEALRLLDDLESSSPDSSVGIGASDSVGPNATTPSSSSSSSSRTDRRPGGGGGEASAFLDELQLKASEPTSRPSSTVHNTPISRSGTPTIRKSMERVKLGGGGGGSSIPLQKQLSLSSSSSSGVDNPNTKGIVPSVMAAAADSTTPSGGGRGGSGGWGWTTSAWGAASSMFQQAKNVVDEQVKHLPTRNEQARKWGEGMLEYAKNTQLDKLGQDFKRVGLSTLSDILNVVAPPISEHEVIQVWLSHDMQGYDGIESLTYRSLTRIMEQVEGGDLIVNRGNESKPKESSHRDLNAADDYEMAIKLCQANIDQLVKSNRKCQPQIVDKPTSPESSMTTPTTYSHVYLRIQPFFTTLLAPSTSDVPASMDQQQFSFLVYLSDPEHQLARMTMTQSVPCQWLEIFDDYEWVEELIAEVLRVGVEVIGQEYIVARMGWAGKGGQPMKEVENG